MLHDGSILEQMHEFAIKGMYIVKSASKESFVLTVKSKYLLDLWIKYGLSEELRYKDRIVPLHITVGIMGLV